MSQPELLKRVVSTLQALGIGHFVTGSVASSMQGEPRSTHDIDIVVQLTTAQTEALLAAFPAPEFYLSADAVKSAVRNRSMFNLLVPAEGDKVDFWLLTDSPFDRSRFARKVLEQAFGFDLFFSSPEDTILAKLMWDKLSEGSAKQRNDIQRIVAVRKAQLNYQYIHDWANSLDVFDTWQQILADSETQ